MNLPASPELRLQGLHAIQDLSQRLQCRNAARLHQSHLERKSLVGRPSHLLQRSRKAVEKHDQPLRVSARSLLLYRLQVRCGKFDDRAGIIRDPRDDEVPDMFDNTSQELTHILPLFQQRIDLPEQTRRIPRQEAVREDLECFLGDRAKNGLEVLVPDLHAAIGNGLVQKALGIPHAAFGGPCDQVQSLVADLDPFFVRYFPELCGDLGERDPLEAVTLAAGMDRGGDLLGLGGGKDENDMGRRLFEGLEEGVERLVREHVNLVDHIDLVLPADGRVLYGLSELANMFNAAVRGAVDLDHIHRGACRGLKARIAFAARRGRRTFLAVQSLGKDARRCGLSHSPRAGEQKGMGQTVRRNGVLEGPGDVALTDHVLEHLGTPFSREHLVAHGILTTTSRETECDHKRPDVL